MKNKQEPIPEKDLVWRRLSNCEICHTPLEVANINESEVRLRHVETKVSYEACRRQKQRTGTQHE